VPRRRGRSGQGLPCRCLWAEEAVVGLFRSSLPGVLWVSSRGELHFHPCPQLRILGQSGWFRSTSQTHRSPVSAISPKPVTSTIAGPRLIPAAGRTERDLFASPLVGESHPFGPALPLRPVPYRQQREITTGHGRLTLVLQVAYVCPCERPVNHLQRADASPSKFCCYGFGLSGR
jgi:hypothetical protein